MSEAKNTDAIENAYLRTLKHIELYLNYYDVKNYGDENESCEIIFDVIKSNYALDEFYYLEKLSDELNFKIEEVKINPEDYEDYEIDIQINFGEKINNDRSEGFDIVHKIFQALKTKYNCKKIKICCDTRYTCIDSILALRFKKDDLDRQKNANNFTNKTLVEIIDQNISLVEMTNNNIINDLKVLKNTLL